MSANVIIQFRRGTASEWTSANPTLATGEVGLETDTSKLKIGDGSTAWNSLGYLDTASYNDLGDLSDVTITSANPGDILEWNGSAWVNTTLAFDDLSDVDMTTVAPSEGDIAYYDGAKWVAQPWNFTSGAGVTVTSATDGQILTYDDATGAWVNSDLVITTTLEDLTDTTITSASDGDLLVYRTSTGWTNEPPETAHPLAY